eukprot:5063273-Pleurochrysis_carterae.AAC.1
MMYKWGHPVAYVAILPSDGGDYTWLSLNDVNSANHHPFPGYDQLHRVSILTTSRTNSPL